MCFTYLFISKQLSKTMKRMIIIFIFSFPSLTLCKTSEFQIEVKANYLNNNAEHLKPSEYNANDMNSIYFLKYKKLLVTKNMLKTIFNRRNKDTRKSVHGKFSLNIGTRIFDEALNEVVRAGIRRAKNIFDESGVKMESLIEKMRRQIKFESEWHKRLSK